MSTSDAAPLSGEKESSSWFNPGMNWHRPSLRHPTTAGSAASPRNSVTFTSSIKEQFPDYFGQDEDDNEVGEAAEYAEDDVHNELDDDNHPANVHRRHKEAHDTLRHMLRQSRGGDYILKHFIAWVVCPNVWPQFWDRFRPDGTMSWKEFEQFVYWESKWKGETQEAFSLLDENQCGYITTRRCNELKHWYMGHRDKGVTEMKDFHKKLAEHYGNLGRAWRHALDKHDIGHCAFNTFCRTCHSIGIVKQLKTLWAELTEGDVTRPIYYRDLDPDGDMALQTFATEISLHGGDLVSGWQLVVEAGGGSGKLHRNQFINVCSQFGIGMPAARWLFAVLDNDNDRVISEFDDLTFLKQFDPGPLTAEFASVLVQQKLVGAGTPLKPFRLVCAQTRRDKKEDIKEDINLEVVLTSDEHAEYQRKLKLRQMIRGNAQ